MGHPSKRNREIAKLYDPLKVYSLKEAIAILQQCPTVKFNQSIDISVRVGVDPRKSDQLVRGTVLLPNGTGQETVILVFARGDKVNEALAAGADFAGHDELLEKVTAGWTAFDAVIATPDMMRDVGKLGKVLGPRGLMPTPKAGTVTNDIAKAIQELKSGKIEFKLDRHAVLNNAIGKLVFEADKIEENARAYLNSIVRAKPSGAKGQYLKSIYLSSTMGPGLRVDLKEVEVI